MLLGDVTRSSRHIFQQTQSSSSPPPTRRPGPRRRSCVVVSAKTMRSAVAAAMPIRIALLRCSLGSPDAASPMTMALSPASTRSIMMTCKKAEKACGEKTSIMRLPCTFVTWPPSRSPEEDRGRGTAGPQLVSSPTSQRGRSAVRGARPGGCYLANLRSAPQGSCASKSADSRVQASEGASARRLRPWRRGRRAPASLRSASARRGSAMRAGGSPARRGSSRVGTFRPVTASTVRIDLADRCARARCRD